MISDDKQKADIGEPFLKDLQTNQYKIYGGYTYPDCEVVELAVKIQHLLSPDKYLTLIVAGTVHIVGGGVMFLEGCDHGLEGRLSGLHELQCSVSDLVHVPIEEQLTIPSKFRWISIGLILEF